MLNEDSGSEDMLELNDRDEANGKDLVINDERQDGE